ncbi:hypothetical protein JCM10449v2_000423 [Rhodotorula kratochvilovae]
MPPSPPSLAAPLGNALPSATYAAGRAAALQYARENGFANEDCFVEIGTQWGDMDANAHINNVVPLRWLESGRGTFMRAAVARLTSAQAREDLNGSGRGKGVIFGEVRYRYLRPIFHPDNVLVLTDTLTISPKTMTVRAVVYSYAQQAPVGTGEGVLFAYDYDAGKSCEWGEELVELMVQRGAKRVGFEGKEGGKAKL